MLKSLLKELNKPLFAFGLLLSLIGAGLGLFLPQVIGKLLEQSFLTSLSAQPLLVCQLIVFFVLVYALRGLAHYLLGRCGSQMVNQLQKRRYGDLLTSRVEELESYSSGDLASRLTTDMTTVFRFITAALPNMFLNGMVVIGSIYFLWQISPSLTLLSLLPLPIVLVMSSPINRRLETHYTNYQTTIGHISSQISHKFTHHRLIKAFCGQEEEAQRMAKSFDGLAGYFKAIIVWSSVQQVVLNSFIMGFIVLLLILAGRLVTEGQLTMSALTTFVLYLTQLIEPLSELGQSVAEVAEFKGVSTRLSAMSALTKEEVSGDQEPVSSTAITFDKVDFTYGDKLVLNQFSAVIPEGKHVAIVGPSGSGKSTIFALLLAFYRHYRGHIYLGDVDLGQLSGQYLRQQIGYVSQTNTLFQGTVRENLLYGKNAQVSEQRLWEVLEALGLSKLVRQLENGLDTVLSDSGTGLSEGEKQRFNIARAFLIEHPIYLLDEVTASLDRITEERISQAIDRLTAGKTRLTIAHRLNTVKNADLILVLGANGQVVDMGNHQELLQRQTMYQEFVADLQKAS